MIFRFFSFLDGKLSFGVNLVQKFKTFSLRRNLIPRLFEYVKFDGDVSLFCFGPFFASFVQKIHFNILILPD